jgi:hypothetical protein
MSAYVKLFDINEGTNESTNNIPENAASDTKIIGKLPLAQRLVNSIKSNNLGS